MARGLPRGGLSEDEACHCTKDRDLCNIREVRYRQRPRYGLEGELGGAASEFRKGNHGRRWAWRVLVSV